jgi:two-component system, OmpR family, sensor histidine kinase KdpD
MSSTSSKLSVTPAATTHSPPVSWKNYAAGVAVVTAAVLLGWVSHSLGLATTNIAMIFLACVVITAVRFGRGPAITAAVLGALAFDFFFVAPIFAFERSDTQYLVTLFVMLAIGVVISELTARLQAQLRAAQAHERQTAELFHASQRQERRTAQLYRMTRQLSELAGTEFLVPRAGRQLTEIFDAEIVLFLANPDGELQLRFGLDTSIAANPVNLVGARWVAENHRPAGLGTEHHPESTALLIPLVGSQRTVGVFGARPHDAARCFNAEEHRMLETCASLIALSIERDLSRLEVQQVQLRVQAEQFRNSLLSSVSHDLRTPLAMIAVAAASLLENKEEPSSPTSREALQLVVSESHRVARQVDNLLEMARLDSGTLSLNCEWQVLEELIGVVLARLRSELQEYPVQVTTPDDLPLLWVAAELIEQVLVNLLENAVRYTPPGSRLEITAHSDGHTIEISVADNGPGLIPGSEAKVFDKFYRGRKIVADGQRGIGLGLPICQGIIKAHGGDIRAVNRPTGGAEFIISLPCREQTLDTTSNSSNLMAQTQS